MSIRIVSHCWAEELPQFAAFLRIQMSSLILHPPKVPVKFHLFYSPLDDATWDVLSWFTANVESCCDATPMVNSSLGRRCIGRNYAALRSTEELIWHTDVDHVFHDGCLDALWELWQGMKSDKITMIYPRHIMIHKNHEMGDVAAESCGEGLVDINTNDFETKRYNRAIGGVQIVPGEFAREYGYLKEQPKWQKETDKPFGDFKDDVAYRKFCESKGRIERIELPGLYRLRHTRTTYQ